MSVDASACNRLSGARAAVRVEKLSKEHFRNLDSSELTFAPGINLIVGDNGQGKTNLLEAICFFKFGRSFRTHQDIEMIRFGGEFCRIEADCVFDDGHTEIFTAAIETHHGKTIKISGEKTHKLSKLVGRYPVVLFGPQDLRLVSGQPSERRRFVDIAGSATDSVYLALLKEYRRVLTQRNAALKARATREEREAWTKKLVKEGSSLIIKRLETMEALNGFLKRHTKELQVPLDFSLAYDSAIFRDDKTILNGDNMPGVSYLEEIFEKKLVSLEREELRRGITLAGPHRDDIIIKLEGRDLKKYGSQGQHRLLAILLKLSELSHLEKEKKESCVLVMDDVFSEFDQTVTGKLQGVLGGGRQVFVTSPVSLDWAETRTVRKIGLVDGVATL